MSFDISGFQREQEQALESVDLGLNFVEAIEDISPGMIQAELDAHQEVHRRRQLKIFGEPVSQDDFDARWIDFDVEIEMERMLKLAEENAKLEAEYAPQDNEAALIASWARKDNGSKPNNRGSKFYPPNFYERRSNTKGMNPRKWGNPVPSGRSGQIHKEQAATARGIEDCNLVGISEGNARGLIAGNQSRKTRSLGM